MRLDITNEERDLLLAALASLQMVSESSAQFWLNTKTADAETKARRYQKEQDLLRRIAALTRKIQMLR